MKTGLLACAAISPGAAKPPPLPAAQHTRRHRTWFPASATPKAPATAQATVSEVDDGFEGGGDGAAEGIDEMLEVDDAERLGMAVCDGATDGDDDALAICEITSDALATCDGAPLVVALGDDGTHGPRGQLS
jgi:hypothetical protein